MHHSSQLIKSAYIQNRTLHIVFYNNAHTRLFHNSQSYLIIIENKKKIIVGKKDVDTIILHTSKETKQLYPIQKKPNNNELPYHNHKILKATLQFALTIVIIGILLIPISQRFNDIINNPLNDINTTAEFVSNLYKMPLSSVDAAETTQHKEDKTNNNSQEFTDITTRQPKNQTEYDIYCDKLIDKFKTNSNISILKISKIGVCTTVKSGDPDKIMKKGAWLDNRHGTLNLGSQKAIVISAHRFGYTWWSKDFKRLNSFANLDKLKPGDKVYIFRNGTQYTYTVFKTDTNQGLIPAGTDLALYTCIGFYKKERYFVYLKHDHSSFTIF